MTIIELLEEGGVVVYQHGEHHHVTPGWIGIDCPYCGPNTASLGIPLERPVVGSCWRCGPHPIYDVLVQLGGRKLAAKLKSVDIELSIGATNNQRKRRFLVKPGGIKELAKMHVKFLLGRGLDPYEVTNTWGVKGIRLASQYPWSLYIPVTLDGEEVSFTTRRILPSVGRPPYQNASPEDEIISIKDVLYGADMARDTIIICEGPLDAWKIGPGGCCTFGAQYTQAQVLQMIQFRKRIICLDAEPDAQRQARKLRDQLAVFPGDTYNVALETGKDPSRAKQWEVDKLKEMLNKE